MDEKTINQKLRKTFDAFPGVDHLYHDDKEVYFHERAKCTRVIRAEFYAKPTKKVKENGE
jgi:hypothetical protein